MHCFVPLFNGECLLFPFFNDVLFILANVRSFSLATFYVQCLSAPYRLVLPSLCLASPLVTIHYPAAPPWGRAISSHPHTFQQAEHIMNLPVWREGQDCLLSQKAKHLGWESLAACLRTLRGRTRASGKCSGHCNLHSSSIQLCFKESHLNTQYISSCSLPNVGNTFIAQ